MRHIRRRFQCPMWWRKLIDSCYPFCYYIGIYTIRMARQAKRTLKTAVTPLFRVVKRFWMQHVWNHVRHWGAEWKKFLHGLALYRVRVAEAWKRHPLEGIWSVVSIPFRGVYRHRRGILTMVNLFAPLLAAYALFLCIGYWNNATYALQVEYLGTPIGYIADESVFDAAATLAEERVAHDENVTFTIDRSPVMTVTLAQEDDLQTETELCDRLLQLHDSEVTELTGVYVNDRFVGTLTSEKRSQALLQALLDSHRHDTYDSDEITFVQNVKTVNGLYPVETVLSVSELQAMLTDRSATEERYVVQAGDTIASIAEKFGLTSRKLVLLNEGLSAATLTAGKEIIVCEPYGYLDVQVVRLEKTEETIPYTRETVYDSNRFIGDNYTKISGQNGIRTYTDRVMYVDGQEIGRERVSVEVTKTPITEVYAIGSYRVDSGATSGVATGQFTWPVPSSYNVSYGWYGYAGHRGIDILGAYGASILAVDGGRVVEVNYTSYYGQGWGYYVLIDHGNGYMTRYAHLSSVLVNYGDYITKGELIGRMGDTGRAYGVHLHFEVYRGGVRVDPYPFLP